MQYFAKVKQNWNWCMCLNFDVIPPFQATLLIHVLIIILKHKYSSTVFLHIYISSYFTQLAKLIGYGMRASMNHMHDLSHIELLILSHILIIDFLESGLTIALSHIFVLVITSVYLNIQMTRKMTLTSCIK